MTIFKPKSGPVIQWSRLVHLLLAATITGYGGHLGGYQGAVMAGFGAIALGFGWEVANRWMGGVHPFGDAWDFWAFVIGATLTGIGFLAVV